MSNVFSFRLDEKNPREARAIAVLMRMQKQGFKPRYILVEALLSLESTQHNKGSVPRLDDISQQISRIQEQLANMGSGNITTEPAGQSQPDLQNTFLTSIRQAARPGLRDRA
jgi:hypothetical protein